MLAPANGGRPVETDLVAKLVERSLAFVEEQRDAATERFLAVAEPTDADHDGSGLDADALDSVRQIALTCLPVGSMVDWSDDADESGVPLKLMTVISPAPADVTHEAYLAFMRAWVRLEPPQRRRRGRVSFCSGARG